MEITDGIHLINGVKGQNIYLLVDEDLTLIDSGFPGNGRVIAQYIEGMGRRLDELKRVLITHSHPDHTGSVPELKDMLPALHVMAHRADTSRDAQGRHLVSYLNVFGATRLPVPFLRRVEADGFLEEGQVLPILGGLRVTHTPGHTPGSVCFYLESRRAIFVGDNVVNLGNTSEPLCRSPRRAWGSTRSPCEGSPLWSSTLRALPTVRCSESMQTGAFAGWWSGIWTHPCGSGWYASFRAPSDWASRAGIGRRRRPAMAGGQSHMS